MKFHLSWMRCLVTVKCTYGKLFQIKFKSSRSSRLGIIPCSFYSLFWAASFTHPHILGIYDNSQEVEVDMIINYWRDTFHWFREGFRQSEQRVYLAYPTQKLETKNYLIRSDDREDFNELWYFFSNSSTVLMTFASSSTELLPSESGSREAGNGSWTENKRQ